MLPRPWAPALPAGVTSEEFKRLLVIRRETLDAATARVSGGRPLPLSWRAGWTATLKILGRDRDGALKAAVTVRGTRASHAYVRKVRLCREHTLNLNER